MSQLLFGLLADRVLPYFLVIGPAMAALFMKLTGQRTRCRC